MVVLLTPDVVRSPNINFDVGDALGKLNYRGRLIPVLAAPPGQLPEEQIPWILKKLPMISLRNGEKKVCWRLSKRCKTLHSVRLCLPLRCYPMRPFSPTRARIRILWPGSSRH